MNPKIQGEVTLILVRKGINKNGDPYVVLANGRKECYVALDNEADLDLFSDIQVDDEVTLEVQLTAGADNIKILEVK